MDTTARKVAAFVAGGLLLTGVGATVVPAVASPRAASATPSSATSQVTAPTAAASGTATTQAGASARAGASAKASASTGTRTTASATGPSASPSPTASASTAATFANAATTGDVPVTAAGQSQVLSSSQQSTKVGAIFSSSSITPGNHHCTASVVDSPAGDVIVTAGHCLGTDPDSAVFVPGYRDGSAPDGVWKITQVIENSAWTGDGDQDDDVAFALVAPQNGQSLESAVGGGYTLSTSGTTSATVQMTGYPSATDEPITCTGDASAFSSTQLVIDCTAFTGGTSGTAWLAGYDSGSDQGSIIGVIGGYQQGGDTADVSYSIVFGPATQSLYEQAVTS
ncbi:serine protease [Streptacidiphilus sp. MAP12-33]|uniref:trypsin-like serine peptidase n=1 Tax=Streptacidiphilus sp. MAP12-33 TaxID=3156266 RepID=UPI0035142909